MSLRPVRIIDPATTPVTLAELKGHLAIGFSDDDALLQSALEAATEHFDGTAGVLGRAIMPQTWAISYGDFACLRLPLEPVILVTGITYFDSANAQQTLSPTVYQLFTDAEGPVVSLTPSQSWPDVYNRPDAVTVTFQCGYTDVPAPIKTAIMLLAASLFEHRESDIVGDTAIPTDVFKSLVAPYRRLSV